MQCIHCTSYTVQYMYNVHVYVLYILLLCTYTCMCDVDEVEVMKCATGCPSVLYYTCESVSLQSESVRV